MRQSVFGLGPMKAGIFLLTADNQRVSKFLKKSVSLSRAKHVDVHHKVI